MPAAGLTPSVSAGRARASRLVAVEEMPDYSQAAHACVDRAIAALPAERIWFTYKDIRVRFGVSRATVARRLKEGLVPGVLLQDGRVVEDAPVRRFDRLQLRWLLLAVRFHRAPSAPPPPLR